MKQWREKGMKLGALAGLWMVSSPAAFATTGGTSMPWDEPLIRIQENLTGPGGERDHHHRRCAGRRDVGALRSRHRHAPRLAGHLRRRGRAGRGELRHRARILRGGAVKRRSLRTVPFHSSLTRPILLGGAERDLVIIEVSLIAALLFGVGFRFASLGPGPAARHRGPPDPGLDRPPGPAGYACLRAPPALPAVLPGSGGGRRPAAAGPGLPGGHAVILREHRPKPQGLADLLNWAALVGEGIAVNKDGSFLAGWSYTGPDLDAATAEELALLSQHFNQALLPLGDEWLLNADAIRRPSRDYPPPGPFPDPTSGLLDDERREQYESGRRNYETTYTLCVSWLPPDELQSSLARWFISGEDRKGPDWRAQVETFVDRLEDIEDRLSASLALTRLSSEALLTHLHTCLTGLYHRSASRIRLATSTCCSPPMTSTAASARGRRRAPAGLVDHRLPPRIASGRCSISLPDSRWSTGSLTASCHSIPSPPRSTFRLYRRNWWQKRNGLGRADRRRSRPRRRRLNRSPCNRDARADGRGR